MILSNNEQKKLLKDRWKVLSLANMSDEERMYYQLLAVRFYNKTNPSLGNYIRTPRNPESRNAWTDLSKRLTNTYLVVDTNVNEIVFYFSLSCGMLYSDIYKAHNYTQAEILFLNTYRQALNLRDRKALKELRVLSQEFGMEESTELMEEFYKEAKNDRKVTKEENPSLFIAETFPGIELTHFCKNDQYFGKPLGISLKTGAFIFWELMVPEIKKIAQKSAAKYLYLFAAESPETRKLIPYYQKHLQFEQMSPLSNPKTIKPFYDYQCFSMMQEIEKLDQKKKEYYDSLKKTS